MKFFRLIVCALLCLPSGADAFWHGSASAPPPPAIGKSVINFNYPTSDLYNNNAKGITFGSSGLSPTSLFNKGYPSGILPTDMVANPNPVANTGIVSLGYYGHFFQQWTGVTAIKFQFNGPIIVYNGGIGVTGVTPSNTGQNNGADNEFTNSNHVGSALANTSIVGNGTTATVTTTANHGLTIGSFNALSLAGTATPSFNGIYLCQAASINTLTCPSAVSGTAGTPGTWQLNNTDMNVEFSFGTLIASVGTNGGLVEMTTPTNGVSSLASSFNVQLHNGITGLPTGPNADGSWTATKTGAQSFTLAGSSAFAGSVTVTGVGGPGVQSEANYVPGNGNVRIEALFGSVPVSHNFSNWIFARADRIADLQAGHIVSQAVINDLGASGLNAGYARYMDAVGAQGVYANFSDRIPADQMFYGVQWRSGKWAGTSTNSGDNYTVANPSDSPAGAYQDGEVVQFTVNSTQTGYKPTLQLGTRGAAPIMSATAGFGQPITNYSPLNIFFNAALTAHANSSVTGNGTTMTVTTASPHGLTNSAVYGITIAGTATPSFNATLACTVTGGSTFTCPSAVSGTSVTPGTYQVQTAPGDIISVTLSGGTLASPYVFQYYVNTTAASITASIAAGTNVLNVSAAASGTITPGQSPNGSSSNGVILAYGTSGTTGIGGTGTYALSIGKSSLTSITSAQGNQGADINIGSNVASNFVTAINSDMTLAAASFSCGNSQFTSTATELCSFYISQGLITGSASVSGLGAEAVNVGSYFVGQITASSNRTMQYSGRLQAWLDLSANGLFYGGIPFELIAEVSARSGVGAFIDLPLEYTQSSWTSAGAFFAANMPGVPIITEISNELWNQSAQDFGRAKTFGFAMGIGGGGASFEPVYAAQGILTIQNLGAFTSGYTGAGGSASLVHPTLQNWALSSTPAPPDNGTMQPFKWNGVGLSSTAATGTGVFGTTNGFNTVTISGISGALFSGYSLAGSCVTGTPHIVKYSGVNFFDGNGIYLIDSVQSGTCTVTATNPAYALASGPGGTAASISYNAFPSRPIDQVDGVGYAVYYDGALAGQGAGAWNGTQSFYNVLFQASEDYAQGVATSNNTLIQGALNAWNTDLVSGDRNGAFAQARTVNSFLGQGHFTNLTGVSPTFETLIAQYDGARPSGKTNLNVYQYEGSQQVTLAANSVNGSSLSSATDLNSQFTTTNGWTALDATYGYPSFGAGSSVTATNITNLFFAFVQSPQFYHTQLCLWQQTAAIHSPRQFYGAQYGLTNNLNLSFSAGASLWGLYTGNVIATTKEQNWFAERDFSNGVTATCP